jgi:hypothetical protein
MEQYRNEIESTGWRITIEPKIPAVVWKTAWGSDDTAEESLDVVVCTQIAAKKLFASHQVLDTAAPFSEFPIKLI